MSDFRLNIPITKVDEEQRIVYGYATGEEVDVQGDIVDYEASKTAFQRWGGNIREQHDAKRAIGKRVSTEFDDENKRVLLGAYISKSPDGENAWTKIQEGILTAFSIGGKIYKTVRETVKTDTGDDKEANRILDYDLSEVSVVDKGAYPQSQFIMVKSFDGKVEEVEEMHVAADGQVLPWFMKSFAYAPDQVNYFNKTTDNKNMNRKEHSMSTEDVKELEKATAVVGEEARDANGEVVEATVAVAEVETEEDVEGTEIQEKSDKGEMKKGLYTVAELAACVENLTWIVESAEWEAQYEGDGSTVPAQLKAAVAQVGAALTAMTTEEVAEATQGDDDVEVLETVELADRPTDLEKMVDSKFDATKDDMLKAFGDVVAGKVTELITPLKDRIDSLEKQPAGSAPVRQYTVIDKVADAQEETDMSRLLKKAEAMSDTATPAERAALAAELFKANSRQRPMPQIS